MSASSLLKANLKMCAVLKIAVNSKNQDLVEVYKTHIEKHNSTLTDSFPNSGFDLFVPEKTEISSTIVPAAMVSMDIKCEMTDNNGTSPYFMFPRSSFSKTPLLLANHTGIIDSGYRGFLIGAFRNLDKTSYTIEKHTKLLQICHPSLCPVHVVMVEEEELSTTSRGEGGFGSTG